MNARRCIASIVFLAALAPVAPRTAQAAETEDALIKGATDFLLDRANDNYMYVFERKLASNPILTTYLPETLRIAQAGDLRSLLTNRAIWEQAVKKDLMALGKLDLLKSKIAPLVERLCKEAYKPQESLLAKICGIAPDNLVSRESFMLVQGRAPNRLGSVQRASVRLYRFDSDKNEILAQALTDLVYDINRAIGDGSSCKGLGTQNSGNSYTWCVIEITSLLAAAAHAEYVVTCTLWGAKCDDRALGVHKEDDDFDDFRRYALFFAQMADAKDPSTVKALLKSVTVPPVSFGIKREPHRTHVLITSYLGGAWATPKHSNEQTFAIAAPIGVEVSQAGGSGNSFSLLLSPIDFGYPVSLKLNGVDTRVRTPDILVPSAYVFWGHRNYPFAAGVGYARVKSIETPDSREGRVLLLLAFDMPLFKLR